MSYSREAFQRKIRAALHRHLRLRHRAGQLSHLEWVVADTLLCCLAPGASEFQISYSRIAKLAHVARSTAVKALKKLRLLGVLTWRQTRIRVAWAGGVASRQWRNVYRFLSPPTDADSRPANQEQVSKKAGIEEKRWRRLGPQPPIRSVAEQLALLSGASSAGFT